MVGSVSNTEYGVRGHKLRPGISAACCWWACGPCDEEYGPISLWVHVLAPELLSTKNLDSSVKTTGVQSLTVHMHMKWVCAHCKRLWIWRCVKGMRIAGLRDPKPTSCNLFLTVCVLTQRLHSGSRYVRS
jgi:hypothetical protein